MNNRIINDIKTIYKDTQSDIAKKLGVSRQRISDIKNNLRSFNLNEIRQLIKLYPELSWLEILGEEDY